MPGKPKHTTDQPKANPVDENPGERMHLRQLAAKKEQLIETLTTQAAYHEERIHELTLTVNDLERQMAEIKSSTSWKITKPFRVLARILKFRSIPVDDRNVLLFKFQRLYQRLPLAVKTKRALRKFFYRITGWPTVSQVIAEDLAGRNEIHPRPEIAGLSQLDIPHPTPGLNTATYTGRRAAHGKRRAAVLTNMLLDWKDGRPRFGGGERYALELARLLKQLGIEVTFFQPSDQGHTESDYFGFKVKTFPQNEHYAEFYHGACTYFTEHTQEYDHVYYHLPEYASGVFREDGLMTCHGIWFDHNHNPDAQFKTGEWFNHLFRAFSNPKTVTCVDTHSMSFIRSLWPELSPRLRYIPNFYDKHLFFPAPGKRDPHKTSILFPRRSHVKRGSRLFPDIVSQIPSDVRIDWIGEGDSEDTDLIKEIQAADERVRFQAAEFNDMPAWYQQADIVVIPSIASEGTSLACIEALACGCAVVATNVGGLSDLIIDGYNGLLVDPNADAIAEAVNYLIDNPTERQRLQANAPQSAAVLELTQWQNKWALIFLEQGWIDNDTYSRWKKTKAGSYGFISHRAGKRWVILTRNAIHGGVESLIREQQFVLHAPVMVCGGHDFPETCPFEYTYIDKAAALSQVLQEYDAILYHWLPDWAVEVVKNSGKTSLEFVHRMDTSDNDKSVPAGIVTHSQFMATYIQNQYGLSSRVIDHPVDASMFTPALSRGTCVGAITSYFKTKGIDLFLEAWSGLQTEFPDLTIHFYGWGEEKNKLEGLAKELRVKAEFLPSTKEPWKELGAFRCFVVPSRLEGFPVSILEALAMNIPVAAADLEGMREFNQKAIERGYPAFIHTFKAEDKNDLAWVLEMTLQAEEKTTSREYIKKYYSPQRHGRELRKYLQEIEIKKAKI